jgi:hypothetical protein
MTALGAGAEEDENPQTRCGNQELLEASQEPHPVGDHPSEEEVQGFAAKAPVMETVKSKDATKRMRETGPSGAG